MRVAMRAFVYLVGCLFAAPVLAEEILEEVLVEARSLQARGGEGASVGYVDEQAMELLRPTHISEALARVPGVWISRGSGHEHLTAIRSEVLAGAGACGAFLFLEDGVPIRPTGFCNVNNLFEVNSEQAQAVEVWRGPGSAVLGGNALRGAINVRTRLPERNRIGLEGGAYGYGQARVELAAKVGAFDAGVAAHTTRSNGWRDDTGYEQHKVSAVAEGTLGGWDVRATLSGSALHQETGGFVLGTDAYRDSALRDSNPNPEAYRDAWALRAAVLLSRDGWRITPYARSSEMRFIQHFLPGQPIEENDQTSVGALIVRDFSDTRYELTVGMQIEAFNGTLEEFQPGPTVGSAFLVATRPQGQHYDYDVDGYSVAAYYDLSWQLADEWRLLHSARAERLHYDYDNQMLVGNSRDDGTVCGFGGCLYTRPADRDDDYNDLAGRLGVAWSPEAGWGEVYATLGTGFRPPQATELYRLQSGQLVTDLDSERITALEIGVRTPHVEVAAFSQRVRNFIFRDAQGFNVSDGKTRSHGIEAAFDVAFGAHGLALAATWAKHRYDFNSDPTGREVITSGDTVDTAPEVMANLRWRYQWSERVSQELEVVYMDDYFTNAENTRTYDGHTVVNWRARWQLSDAFSVHARVINLFDREYADRADFAFGNDRYFPAMPRQLYVGFDYGF